MILPLAGEESKREILRFAQYDNTRFDDSAIV
jgi:hypothetical protein